MCSSDFNSIKVRLEPACPDERGGRRPFQFHKGAIRTSTISAIAVVNPAFQFHKGAIRTAVCAHRWAVPDAISIP